MAGKTSLAVLTGPHSVPLTSAQVHPPPGSRQGLYQGSWKESVAQHGPCPGPTWGGQTHPELHACPMLSVRVCSPPPWPSACTTLPAAPLPLPRSLETCPFCFSILPLLLFIVMVVSRLGRRRGSGPLSPRLCLSQSPWLPPSRPAWPQRPVPRLPLHSSP